MWAGILVIACVCLPISGGAQKPTRSEQARRVYFNGVRMATILANIAFDYDVTIGLETDPEKADSQINLDLRDVHFTQILDGIVKAEPRYQWRERDECIEVFPIAGGSSLLDTPIQSFRVRDVNRDLALNRLLGLPEVRALTLSMKLKMRPPYPQSERTKDEKLSFDLSGVTLRQALNRIASDSGARFWVYRRYPDGTFEITLSCCP